MKRILLFFALFLLLTSVAFAGSFPDVPKDHDNYGAIEYLESNGIINGYDDGTFRPDALVNRAEAVKIIVGAFGIDHEGSFDKKFPDVSSDQWFFPYVMAGYQAGLVQGYDSGYYKPGDPVNLAETLKIISIAADSSIPGAVDSNVFVDVPKDEWYAPFALYAREHNVVLSDDAGKLNANQDMTRAAFSEVIYRMKIVMENNEAEFPLHQNWPYFQGQSLPFKMKYDNSSWTVVDNGNEVAFYKPNTGYSQFSAIRTYPNSAKVIVAMDANSSRISKSQYFSNLKNAFPNAQYTEFNLGSFPAMEILYPEKRIVDWYVYLDDARVLAVYTEYGDGVLGYQLPRIIKSMLKTFEYSPASGASSYENVLSNIFANLLIENKGMQLLNTLPDKLIIETDTIGVGTGPVDYYYSDAVDYTFKYERTADLILDTRQGRSTAF